MEDVDPGCRILGPEVGRTGCAQAFRYHPDGRGVFGDRLPSAVRRAGEFVIGAPKSKAALRTVPLPTGLRPIIRAHLDTFAQAGRSGLVFPSETGNVPHENTVRPHYKRAAARSVTRLCASMIYGTLRQPCLRRLVRRWRIT